MPDGDKTLRETVAAAVLETQDTSRATNTETKEGISEGNEGETNTGETPEFVSGVDISKYPEQERTIAREVLKTKGKLLEDGYQGKFKEVAELKKTKEELGKLGLSPDEVQQVLSEHLRKKQNPVIATEQKKEAIKTLDKLLESVPYDQKANLEQFRQIILEETETSTLKNEIKEMKHQLEKLTGSAVQTQRERLETELKGLGDKYGKDLIDKYHDELVDKALKFNVSARKILVNEYTDEAEQAVLAMSTKGKKPLTTEKKNAISSDSSGITTGKEKVNKNQPWNKFMAELISKK
jgi:hypothetical protein